MNRKAKDSAPVGAAGLFQNSPSAMHDHSASAAAPASVTSSCRCPGTAGAAPGFFAGPGPGGGWKTHDISNESTRNRKK